MNMIKEFQFYCRHNLGLADSTIMEYGKDLHLFVTWLQATAGINRWSQVTRPTVEQWVSEQHANGTAPATIKRRVSAVRRLYQYAWLQGLCSENPAKYVSTPKNAKRLPAVIPVEDITATVTDASVNLSTRFLISVMAEAGLRISEAISLQASQFDTKRKSIKVTGKGNKERVVYYGDMTAQLFAQMMMRGELDFGENERNNRYEIWSAIHEHSEAEKCNPHTLRHTFATKMVDSGASIETVSKLLGHESIQTTERYTHMGTKSIVDSYRQHAPHL